MAKNAAALLERLDRKAPWMKHEKRAPLNHVALEVGDIEEACAAQDWRQEREREQRTQ